MTRIVVIIGFLVAFAAGVAVGTGYLGARNAVGAGAQPTTRPVRDRGWIERELNLTDTQKEQMRKIWADLARSSGREHDDKRRQLRRERDEAIAALVHAEDLGKYDEIINKYSDQTAALDREMHANFEEKIRQTKEILSPEQREKYEKILKDRERDRENRDHDRNTTGNSGGRDPQPKRSDDRATSSRPAT